MTGRQVDWYTEFLSDWYTDELVYWYYFGVTGIQMDYTGITLDLFLIPLCYTSFVHKPGSLICFAYNFTSLYHFVHKRVTLFNLFIALL